MPPHPSGDPVPAIREADATGEVAEIFEDLRQTLGVPVVNLVWRHFATIPGALPFAWNTVAPAYRSGAVAREADGLRASLPLPTMPGLSDEVLAAVGVADEAKQNILTVLDSYHRSNAMNFVALSALLERLDGAGTERTAAQGAPSRITAGIPGTLPHLLTLDEMTASTRRLVLSCNSLGERDDGRILASMYRHLAHWPGFLALSWALVAPLDGDGRLGALIETGISEGRRRGAALLPELAYVGDEGSFRPELRRAAESFVTHPIGKMVGICAILRSSMRPGGNPIDGRSL